MVDFITNLPIVARKDVILVVCNKLSKMMHFVATTEGILVEELIRLFRNDVQKLYRLPESIILDRELYFATDIIRELNSMLKIETKLLIPFYPQTNEQTEQINQELEQYLQFFVDHRQKNWLEWLVSAEFAINNKTHSITKVSPFIANYRRELRMGVNLKRKEKMEKAMGFVEKMKKIQKEAKAVLIRAQEEMKRQADKGRKEAEVWEVGDKVMLSIKDLVFKEQPVKKLVD